MGRQEDDAVSLSQPIASRTLESAHFSVLIRSRAVKCLITTGSFLWKRGFVCLESVQVSTIRSVCREHKISHRKCNFFVVEDVSEAIFFPSPSKSCHF